jgi:hypothetical protein
MSLLAGASMAAIFEDFSGVGDWGAGGANGGMCSITTDGAVASLNYAVTSATGNDYADFYTDQMGGRNDWSSYESIVIKGINIPIDPAMYVQLKVYAGAWAEYTFTQTGTAADYTLKLNYDSASPSLYAWGTMNWSNVQVVQFRLIGDASSAASNGSILIDEISLAQVPEPTTMAIIALGGFLFVRSKK